MKGKILGHIKNINYETKNEEIYKKDTTSEIIGAIGYLTELNLQKNIKGLEPLFNSQTFNKICARSYA